jgi:hypothetical protein
MAHPDNLDRGMSMTENVILDLAGFQPASSSSGANGVQVGPMNTGTVSVDVTTIGVPGAGSKQYYVPDKKYFIAQIAGSQQMAQPPHADVEGAPQLPDVVDAFGTPLLMWVQDDSYITKPGPNSNYTFARRDSGANGSTKAKFYWAYNKCFLTANALGRKAIDQTNTTNGSMMGVDNANTISSITGAFGSPNDPYRDPTNLNAVPTLPRSGRAPFIVQSAGIDGTYFGLKDRGAKQFMNGFIDYRMNFVPDPTQQQSATNQYQDANGRPTNFDILTPFDDLFSTAGN